MKKKLRKKMLSLRSAMSDEEWRGSSDRIMRGVLDTEAYKRANTVFTYVSMGKEVDTFKIIEQAWRDGKRVAAPVTAKEDIYFLEIESLEGLKKSSFGVLEPMGERERELLPQREDIFLVPGLAFDKQLDRCGYGKGYYDKYFAKHKEGVRLALTFDFQVRDENIPTDGFDIAVDGIMTEKGMIGGIK